MTTNNKVCSAKGCSNIIKIVKKNDGTPDQRQNLILTQHNNFDGRRNYYCNSCRPKVGRSGQAAPAAPAKTSTKTTLKTAPAKKASAASAKKTPKK